MAITDTLGKSIGLFGFKVPAVGVLAAGAVLLIVVLSRGRATAQNSATDTGANQGNGATAEDLSSLSDTIDAQLSGLQSDYEAQIAALSGAYSAADQSVLGQLSALETSQQAALSQLSGNLPGIIDQRTAALSQRVTAVEQRTTQLQSAQQQTTVNVDRLGKIQRNLIRWFGQNALNVLSVLPPAQQQAQLTALTSNVSVPAGATGASYEGF